MSFRLRHPDEYYDWFARHHWRQFWDVSERAFKLISWFLACAALLAIYRKTKEPLIGGIAGAAIALWALVLFGTLIKAAVTLQDWSMQRMSEQRSWPWAFVGFPFTLVAVSSGVWGLVAVSKLLAALIPAINSL